MIRVRDELDGQVCRIVLHRPKANVLDAAMIAAISGVLDTLRPDVRLLVFEGAGDHFCFGASVEEHRADRAAEMLAAFHALFRQLATLAVPTMALVRGQCLGGGLELASWCTWIVSTPNARFGQPEVSLAVFPPMASVLLPWRLGGAAALDLCVSGRSWTALEAHQRGLVTAIVEEPEAWMSDFVIRELAAKSAAALRFAERAARVGLMERLGRELPILEAMYLHELMATHDANEGIAAFLERRQPLYTHS